MLWKVVVNTTRPHTPVEGRVPRPALGPPAPRLGSPAPRLQKIWRRFPRNRCWHVLSTRPRDPFLDDRDQPPRKHFSPRPFTDQYQLARMGQERSQRLAVDRERGAPMSACSSKAEVDDQAAECLLMTHCGHASEYENGGDRSHRSYFFFRFSNAAIHSRARRCASGLGEPDTGARHSASPISTPLRFRRAVVFVRQSGADATQSLPSQDHVSMIPFLSAMKRVLHQSSWFWIGGRDPKIIRAPGPPSTPTIIAEANTGENPGVP